MQVVKRFTTVTVTALWLLNGAALVPRAQAAEGPPPSMAASKATADKFPAERLEQLVAPIALFPDALLAQLFMAATYPLDIVQADRWLGEHEGLGGKALEEAVAKDAWDPSVQALVFFPDVLGYMSDNLNWTQDLGDAVLAQQDELMAAVQRLRKEAQAAGTLKSTEEQKVEAKGDTIIVQPADPQTVYVPSYDPATVYGQSAPPATNYYPATYSTPVYQPETTAVPIETVATTTSAADSWVSFGAGALAGGLLTAAILWDDHDDHLWYGGPGHWGGGGYWGGANYWNNGWRDGAAINRDIDINRNINRERNIGTGDITVNRGISGNEIRAGKWEHNAEHRGGVRYRNQETRAKFDGSRRQANIDRDLARGRDPGKLGDRKGPDAGARLGDGKRPESGKIGDRKGSDGDGRRPSGDRGSKAKTREAKVQRPKAEGKVADRAQARPKARTDGGKVSGFEPQSGRLDRAASARGASSRGGGRVAGRSGATSPTGSRTGRVGGGASHAAAGGGSRASAGGGGRSAGGGRAAGGGGRTGGGGGRGGRR